MTHTVNFESANYRGEAPYIARNVLRTMRHIGISSEMCPASARQITKAFGGQLMHAANQCATSEARESFVQSLEAAVAAHHPGTAAHQRRVRQLCQLTFDNLPFAGLNWRERDYLVLAARLHDFGKLCMSRELIDLPRRYTEAEHAAKERHVHHAVWMFEGILWLRQAVRIIRYNHFFDGYPAGLVRANMSLASEILSMADMLDALTDKTRSYRAPLCRADALMIIAARNYTPQVLAAFIKAVDTLGN